MNPSNTNHARWCTDHRGELCMSRPWTVAGIQVFLYGCDTDVPPVFASVRVHVPTGGYHLPELSRLGDALSALAMLGHHTDPAGTDYWTGRLDSLEDRDRETTSWAPSSRTT